MADELNEFVERLKQSHGAHLKSVVLYGDAVEGVQFDDEAPKKALVVLEEITPGELKAAKSVAEWWRAEGNPLPVYFSTAEMQESSDVFPVEFLDMSRVRHIVYGEDPFDAIQIDTRYLRHQLEYELRGKLIRLRSLYMPASSNAARLASLMADSLDSFVVLFRHVLAMKRAEPVSEKQAVLEQLADELRLEKRVFDRIARYAVDDEVWLEEETNETFARYLKLIEQVIATVDRLQH